MNDALHATRAAVEEGVVRLIALVTRRSPVNTVISSQGVIDPTKVVRNALQGAASIAGLLITTEAMVAEQLKKEAAHAPMPGGGMGGMD